MSIAAAVTIDYATPDDVPAAAAVYQAAAIDLGERLRAKTPWLSATARSEDLRQATGVLQHLLDLDTRSVVVARDGGRIVGMAAVQIQPPHAHIAFLFVHPDAQERGIGRDLLDHLQAVISGSGATIVTLTSSRDPRAMQRYFRFGLVPGLPVIALRAQNPSLPNRMPLHPGLSIRPTMMDDLDAIADLDRVVRGADRRIDIETWLRDDGGLLAIDRQTGKVEGYCLVSTRPQHCQIGPVASRTREAFPVMLDLTLHLANLHPNPRNLAWRVDASARNTAMIDPLLRAGFAVDAMLTWFESGSIETWDRYIFRDEDAL
ncbi:MAG TPA: GNAT family N-acetyltransferase [Thermomicrobiales bacterium]|nr:GNAT family N-acetyltransferase [Thermomicrobiales bacterium]